MSDRQETGKNMKSRLLLLVTQRENRRLLAETLEQHYEVVVGETDTDLNQPFDLGIVDGITLDRFWQQVQARKQIEQPLFLPLLLITVRRDVNMRTRHLWKSIDEFIISPIEKMELLARVETLLRARRLSLELKATNIQLQNETIAHQQALEEQKKLQELKDLFISVATHEMRTPLTSIKGYAQLMEQTLLKVRKDESDAATKMEELRAKPLQMIRRISRQAEQIATLVSDLVDFSRIQSQQFQLHLVEEANLTELVQQVVEQQQLINQTHSIVFEAAASDITATYDKNRIEQVLNNLISNAIKYSPPQTHVRVCVEPATKEQEGVVVWIRDEGQGISAEHQAKLFDRFYRVRNEANTKVDGLGLGLYISSEIVKQHGGRMWVESEVGKGSTFYFFLPCSPIEEMDD
jgi:signal transduction histidine kinase